MKSWVGAAIVTAALISSAGYAMDGTGVCGTVRLGETTVATLENAPIVTVFANGAALTLLLDTGAQTTILIRRRPADRRAAPSHNPKGMSGIAGSLQTGEVELRSFSIGGVAIPWRRARVRISSREAAIWRLPVWR